jgi:hypothetical protein
MSKVSLCILVFVVAVLFFTNWAGAFSFCEIVINLKRVLVELVDLTIILNLCQLVLEDVVSYSSLVDNLVFEFQIPKV